MITNDDIKRLDRDIQVLIVVLAVSLMAFALGWHLAQSHFQCKPVGGGSALSAGTQQTYRICK